MSCGLSGQCVRAATVGGHSQGPCKHISTCYFQLAAARGPSNAVIVHCILWGEKVYALMEWIYLGIQKLKIVRIYCTILLPISYTLITVNILFFFFLLLDLIQHGTFISNRLCLKWILSDNKRQFTRLDDQSPYFQFFLIFNFTLKCYIFSTFLLKVSACGFHHVTSHLQWPSLITGRSPASPAFHWGPLQSF